MDETISDTAAPRKARSKVLRGVYFVLGLICLVFVYLSVLPGIPTFDFVILAAFFFSMSSERVHSWMVNHKVFGRIIAGYRDGGLTMKMKWVAAIAITLSIGFSAIVLVDSTLLRIVLAAVGIFAVWYVFTRETRDELPADFDRVPPTPEGEPITGDN